MNSNESVAPVPLARDLGSIFQKYPLYDETNTAIVSLFENTHESFKHNDIVLPLFDPIVGRTDFIDDRHMMYFKQYIQALFAMDGYVGMDIRDKLKAFSYDKLNVKTAMKIRYDSYAYSPGDELRF